MYYANESKMVKFAWIYSDDARTFIENVYKFCVEEKDGRWIMSGKGLQHSVASADLPPSELSMRRRTRAMSRSAG